MTEASSEKGVEHYLGLMSGTSADGIDAAIVSFDADGNVHHLLAAGTRAFADDLRSALIQIAQHPDQIDLATLCALDHQVGQAYAQAAQAQIDAVKISQQKIRAVGMHGQTVFHDPGGAHPNSMQIGDASVVAAALQRPVIADCRRADIAAGGQGAPLAPAFHAAQWQHATADRAIINIGGISNITVLPASSRGKAVSAYDIGPGNCLMDDWFGAQNESGRFDADGAWAASGSVDDGLLAAMKDDAYFGLPSPKSTGRDYFSAQWLIGHLANAGGVEARDVQRTLLELTASTLADAVEQHAPSAEVYLCGGGARNSALVNRFRELRPRQRLTTTKSLGLDADWVEAAAWAWLARQRAHGKAGNLPSVTGAARAVQLGAVHYPVPR